MLATICDYCSNLGSFPRAHLSSQDAAFVEDAFGSDDVVFLAFALVEDGDFLGIFERHLGIDFLRHMPRERQGRAQRRCRGRVCAPVVPSGLRLTWLMDG